MTSLAEEEVQGEKEEERRRALCRAFCRKWDSDESLTETVLATLNGAFDEDEDGGEDQDDVAEDLAHRVEEKIEEVADVLGGLIEALEEAGDGERESATRTLLLEWVGARKGAGSVGTAPVSGSGISSPTVQSSGGGDDLLSAAASASATNCEPLPGVPTVLFALEDAEIERTEPEVRRLRDMGIIPGASPLLLHYLLLRANGNADHAVLEGLAIANRGEVAARNEELSRRRTKHLRSEERRDREERLRAEEERKALVARFGERAELVKGHDQNRCKFRVTVVSVLGCLGSSSQLIPTSSSYRICSFLSIAQTRSARRSGETARPGLSSRRLTKTAV